MKKGIIGKKIGMTQIFDESGKVIPVTVVEAGPCVVVQKKTVENDGYAAVQLGFGDEKATRVNKPIKGHFDKADAAYKKNLKEFRLEDCESVNVGDILKADTFAPGDMVDVSGTSKGKDSRVQSSVTTIQDSRRLTVRVLFTDMPDQWAHALPLQESSRARECRDRWVTKRLLYRILKS